MDKGEITKNNQLIADFMRVSMVGTRTRFEYNDDWDWLMPVLEEIESLPEVDYTKLYSEYKYCYDFKIFLREDKDEPTFMVSTDNKMEAIYLCVIKFIEWYNEQIKK